MLTADHSGFRSSPAGLFGSPVRGGGPALRDIGGRWDDSVGRFERRRMATSDRFWRRSGRMCNVSAEQSE